MVQQHIFDVANAGAAIEGEDGSAVLRFDAANAVRAIVFHLIDDGLAKFVADDSVRRTLDRLKIRHVEPSIARRRWIALNNSQRLRWLLSRTQTALIFSAPEKVTLRARAGRAEKANRGGE